MGQDILYRTDYDRKVAIITLNQPDILNSLNNDQYLQLGEYVKRADEDPKTIFTVLQSTGRFFSSGANVKDANLSTLKFESQLEMDQYWLSKFVGRNIYLTSLFLNHSKILVACLNGPVVGLSSALVALCDLIYSINDSDVYMLLPFSNLGLVCEGAASASIIKRLGLSKANEAILFSKPILLKELYRLGFINECFDFKQAQVDQFNELVLDKVYQSTNNLSDQSILDNKELIKSQYYKDYQFGNATEVIKGFEKWSLGIPQERFMQMAKKQRKHKL